MKFFFLFIHVSKIKYRSVNRHENSRTVLILSQTIFCLHSIGINGSRNQFSREVPIMCLIHEQYKKAYSSVVIQFQIEVKISHSLLRSRSTPMRFYFPHYCSTDAPYAIGPCTRECVWVCVSCFVLTLHWRKRIQFIVISYTIIHT